MAAFVPNNGVIHYPWVSRKSPSVLKAQEAGLDLTCVNRLDLQAGFEPGVAKVLLYRESIEAITPNNHNQTFYYSNGTDEFYFPGWTYIGCESIDPSHDPTRYQAALSAEWTSGWSDSSWGADIWNTDSWGSEGWLHPFLEDLPNNQVVLATFKDIRHIFQQSEDDGTSYNVLNTVTGEESYASSYHDDTLNDSNLWTWQQVLSNLWGKLPGSTTLDLSNFSIPLPENSQYTYTPHNIVGGGKTSWELFKLCLDATGHTLAPIYNNGLKFVVYPYGSSSLLEEKLTQLIYNHRTVANVSGKPILADTSNSLKNYHIPASLNVTFPTGVATKTTIANDENKNQYTNPSGSFRHETVNHEDLPINVGTLLPLVSIKDVNNTEQLYVNVPIAQQIVANKQTEIAKELALREYYRRLTPENVYAFDFEGLTPSYFFGSGVGPDHKHASISFSRENEEDHLYAIYRVGAPQRLPKEIQGGGGGDSIDHPHAIARCPAFTSNSISAPILSVYGYFGCDDPNPNPSNAANINGLSSTDTADVFIEEGDFPEWLPETTYAAEDIVTHDNGSGLRRWSKIANGASGSTFTPALWTDLEAASGWKIVYVFKTEDAGVYSFTANEDIVPGASGNGSVATVTGCAGGSGESQTLCNYKTNVTCWQGCVGTCYKTPSDSYIIASHNGASILKGTADGDSDDKNSWPTFSVSNLVGVDGHFNEGQQTVLNSALLQIKQSDTVVIAGGKAGQNDWTAITSRDYYFGCNFKREGSGEKRIELDVDVLAGKGIGIGSQLTDDGYCTSLDIGQYCGIIVGPDGIGINETDLSGRGLTPGSGCGIDVNPGCGIEVVDDKVQINAAEIASNSSGLSVNDTGGGNCGFKVDPPSAEDILNVIILNIDIIVNAIQNEMQFEEVDVLSKCEGIELDENGMTIKYLVKTLSAIVQPDGGGTPKTDENCTAAAESECT